MHKLESRMNLTDVVANRLRDVVLSGGVDIGSFLPTERELAKQHQVSRVTVRRSLGQLVSEGLLESVPSQGYRPKRTASENASNRLAYVASEIESNNWDPAHAGVLNAFQRVVLPHGVSVLAVGIKNRFAEEIFRDLARSGVKAVALDASDPHIQDVAIRSGLPVIVVNAFSQRMDVDVVIQDNHGGLRSGIEYLVKRGHTRIGFVGPTSGFVHWTERFSGACEGLWTAGLQFKPEDVLQPSHSDIRQEAAELVAKRLREPNPPTALVCPWQSMVLGAADAVKNSDVKPELFGWCNNREYREILAPEFLGGDIPAVGMWKPDELAQLAWERLEYRAKNPQTFSCRINACVRLVEPRKAEDVLKSARSQIS